MPKMYMDNMRRSYDNMYARDSEDGHYMHEELVNTIQECEATCEHMTNHVLKLPDIQKRTKQVMLLNECADICGLTAKYIARGAMFSKHAAQLCACICETCGEECSRFKDEMSQECAQICMHCARECMNFVNMM